MEQLNRTYSDSFIAGMGDYDLFKNKNVDWMSGKFTKVCYIIFVLCTFLLFFLLKIVGLSQTLYIWWYDSALYILYYIFFNC